MSAAELLADLTRQGIELQVHGDRLRYRPRSAVPPHVIGRMQAHKAELLRLLRRGDTPGRPQGVQNRPTAFATPTGRTIGPSILTECPYSSEAPHELSLAERIESGYVNPGWTPAAWRARLRQLAERCEARRPDLAAQYRTWAKNIVAPLDT